MWFIFSYHNDEILIIIIRNEEIQEHFVKLKIGQSSVYCLKMVKSGIDEVS